MVPLKTDKAHAALRSRAAGLSALQRQTLILCNGQRSADELVALLGAQARPTLRSLADQGLLTLPSALAPAPQTPSAPRLAAPPPAAAKKRSLVMARMYAFDMLERALGDQSQVARQHLRSASTPEQLADALGDCVALLADLADSGLARRITAQLLDMLPEDQPALAERIRQTAGMMRPMA